VGNAVDGHAILSRDNRPTADNDEVRVLGTRCSNSRCRDLSHRAGSHCGRRDPDDLAHWGDALVVALLTRPVLFANLSHGNIRPRTSQTSHLVPVGISWPPPSYTEPIGADAGKHRNELAVACSPRQPWRFRVSQKVRPGGCRHRNKPPPRAQLRWFLLARLPQALRARRCERSAPTTGPAGQRVPSIPRSLRTRFGVKAVAGTHVHVIDSDREERTHARAGSQPSHIFWCRRRYSHTNGPTTRYRIRCR